MNDINLVSWWIRDAESATERPVDFAEIVHGIRSGKISPTSQVRSTALFWTNGVWMPINEVSILREAATSDQPSASTDVVSNLTGRESTSLETWLAVMRPTPTPSATVIPAHSDPMKAVIVGIAILVALFLGYRAMKFIQCKSGCEDDCSGHPTELGQLLCRHEVERCRQRCDFF